VEKGGLAAGLAAAGVTGSATVVFADELRLGLHGQVRRRWCPRGVKLRQKLEIRYVWRYLVLGVAAAGKLVWTWLERCRKEAITATITGWQTDDHVDAIVWDNAPSHTAKLTRAAGVPLVALPPYSPELNPAERVFLEVRRAVEGVVYGTIDAKKQAAETFLTTLQDDPERVRRLAGWDWITDALASLPTA